MIVVFKGKKNNKISHKAPAPPPLVEKQAGAELGQAQVKLEVIV